VDFAPDTDEDEFTELIGADFPRVDLVSRPANGAKGFLVMKQDASAGVLDPAMIRDLISKTSEEAPVPATDIESGRTVLPNGVHLSGSPAAMAAFIHAANVRKAEQPEPEPDGGDVAKADLSAKEQNDLPDSAFAYVESGGKKDADGKTTPRSLRHFNISDKAHADNAAARIAQGAKFGDEAKPKVEAAQRKFGEKNVAKEAPVPQAVTKDMMDAAGDAMPLDDGMDCMDPTVPLAMPDMEMGVPGDPTDPGSPAWEAIDAATAAKWLSIAARLKNALGILAEREMLEAASADPSDIENAFDLEDAACAVDYVISTLAVFAAGEMSEAEIGTEMAEMCKALAGLDPDALGVIEGLTAVRKAGRVLSSVNESRIRDAYGALGDVLASLPAAPAAPDQPVAKETEGVMPNHTIDMRGRQLAQGPAADVLAKPGPVVKTAMSPEDQARDTGPVNAGGTTGMGQPRLTGPDSALPGDGPQEARPGDARGRAVVKAAHLSVVVYDRQGRQCITRPDAIMQPVAKADGDDAEKPKMQAVFGQDGDLIGVVDPDAITPVAGAASPAAGDGDADGMQAGPAAAAAPDADDMTPQPPADAGTPADAVGKAADENVTTGSPEALDSIIAKAVAAALGAAAPAQEVVAKQAADLAGALARADQLEARIAKVEETPAAPKVFTNGQVPPAEQLRGQDQGRNSGQIDVAKALERKGELYAAPNARAQNDIAKSMQGDAIDALAAIYAAGPTPARVQPVPVPVAAP
jgi:hypothetical protein